ncbi:hypothetical protein FRC11_009588 [Ceratobasidium sp. 423]|nr:hypothetical protein FRC11_009588 [Ceratobasidium sp. 423]
MAEVQTSRSEPAAPKPPANQRVPRLSQPTPPNHTVQAGPSDKTLNVVKSTEGTLAVPDRSGTGRTLSSPAPPTIASTSQPSGPSRARHQTLPSKLSANKPGQLSSPGPSIPEGSFDYGGGVMQSPAFPPSVHIAGGSRKTAGAPPPVTAPFMKD